MSPSLFSAVYSLAACAIVVRAALGINPMGGKTCHGIRLAVLGMGGGALVAAISPLYGHQVGGTDVVMAVGVAMYVWRDRRRVFEE